MDAHEASQQRRPREILPSEVAKCKKDWDQFLFSGEVPIARKVNVPLPLGETFRKIERFHITYEIEEGVSTEAYLLRPIETQGRLPGVVLFHDSGPTAFEAAASIDEGPETSIAARLVKKGYVVLCPKCFIYGEEAVPATDLRDIHRQEVQRMQRRHPRWTGLARMILDGIRAVDVLCSFPFVNQGRIGTIGHSLGGKQVLFVMAFDKRVKAGVSSDAGIGLKFSNWHDIWYLGQEIRTEGFPLETHQVLAMIAPRAFLIVGGIHDDDRAWPLVAGAKALWDWFGSSNKIAWYRHNGGHRFPPEALKESYRFLNRHLGVAAV